MNNMNLKILARELNLAISTVSRALRDSHDIGQETKDRVRALAEKLGYQPNPYASSLRQNKSNTIAIIIPEIENNFFSQILNGIELVAQSKGYHVLIYLTHEDFQKEKSILQLLRNGRVDGLMISLSNSTKTYEHLQAWKDAEIPMVFFDRVCEGIDAPTITTNDTEVSYKGTEHLFASGCKRIAFLSLSGDLSITNRRKAGYLQALKKNGKENEQVVIECGEDNEENNTIIRKLLRKKNRPDGVFTAIEKLAINVYEVSKELKIEIPDQLKVVSFSNSPAAPLFCPPLTSIIQPAYEIGKEAVTTLFKLIDKKPLLKYEKKVILPSHLCERKSSSGKPKSKS
jgi:LacI family transcriptional regulator